ncbi:MAG: SURF1 family cytochrome oxidase biogenesis protein, partial [Aquihabitans sp.]
MSRYRFALRPWWILSHLFVVALVAAMLFAGFWQLSRLQEKKDRNVRVAARTSEPVIDVESLVALGDFDAVDDLEYRMVTASGEYLAD